MCNTYVKTIHFLLPLVILLDICQPHCWLFSYNRDTLSVNYIHEFLKIFLFFFTKPILQTLQKKKKARKPRKGMKKSESVESKPKILTRL